MSSYRRRAPPRSQRSFPTRTYGPAGLESAGPDNLPPLEPNRVYRFVLGLDDTPRPLTAEESATWLRDPLAELLLKRGAFPQTLQELLGGLDRFDGQPNGLPRQASYFVGDGSQIAWRPDTAALERQLRFAITRAAGADVALLISTGLEVDSDEIFLQVLAWDPANEVFNFYQRIKPAWVWSGNSYHALAPESRGKGPFDSHVNGSMVMKELKSPWINWQSVRANVDSALAADDPVRGNPLFQQRQNAEVFQISVVQPGIERWNRARLRRAISPAGLVSDLPSLLRQVLETTTVNLATSDQESHLVAPADNLRLPITFFLNTDALLDRIGLEPDISRLTVSGRFYLDSLRRYDFKLTDGHYTQPGDTYFAFLVPEPAFEDLDLLSKLLDDRLVTPRFAACLIMVDFPNPVFSPRRAQLMQYVPPTARLENGRGDLPAAMSESIAAAALGLPADSPEHEFLANWRLGDDRWQADFSARIERYFAALSARLATPDGFDDYVRLADSRRREYAKRPLQEFRLTIPTTNIPEAAPLLELAADGTVREKRP